MKIRAAFKSCLTSSGKVAVSYCDVAVCYCDMAVSYCDVAVCYCDVDAKCIMFMFLC